jgi:hypothetical protein
MEAKIIQTFCRSIALVFLNSQTKHGKEAIHLPC